MPFKKDTLLYYAMFLIGYEVYIFIYNEDCNCSFSVTNNYMDFLTILLYMYFNTVNTN